MLMRNFLLFGAVILVVVAGYFILRGDDSLITNYPPRGERILAFGDSLVLGVGATQGNDFISRISRELNVPIINMGRSGDTTSASFSRVDSALATNPDIVLLLLGGNDAIRRVPIEETEENLRRLVGIFHDAGAVVVLIGVRGGITNDPYSNMYRRISRETGSILVTDVLRGLFGDRRYMADAVHPNDAGHEVIARRITLQLRGVLEAIEN
jgi:acyl-CoA thioesterase I